MSVEVNGQIEESEFCPFRTGDILKCVKITNFHEIGEIVLMTGADKRFENDPKPYWVRLAGKPGHYSWESFERASADDVAAALSLAQIVRATQDTREPTAWLVKRFGNDGSWIGDDVYLRKPVIGSTARTDYIPLGPLAPGDADAIRYRAALEELVDACGGHILEVFRVELEPKIGSARQLLYGTVPGEDASATDGNAEPIQELADQLAVEIKELDDIPPSIQRQSNIRLINAVHQAIDVLKKIAPCSPVRISSEMVQAFVMTTSIAPGDNEARIKAGLHAALQAAHDNLHINRSV